eukprot:gene26148-11872_t
MNGYAGKKRLGRAPRAARAPVHSPRFVRASAFTLRNPFAPSVKDQATKSLLAVIEECDRGLSTSAEAREQIEEAVQTLEGLQSKPTTGKDLSGTWALAWTTEKETLWILANAGLFNTEAGDVITFPPEGAFIVDSSISVEGEQRTSFQFTSATIKLPNDKDIKLPPFGKGWFDTVYSSGSLRIARDIRGDLLICRKEGPPRKFE